MLNAKLEADLAMYGRKESNPVATDNHRLHLCAVSMFVLFLFSPILAHAQSKTDPQVNPAKQTSEGTATPTDGTEVIDRLRRLAKEGGMDAQRRLGEALISSPTNTDKTEGIRLLEEAIARGDRKSHIILGRLLMDGQFLRIDLSRARSLFQNAARMGDFQGVELLGEHLMWKGRNSADAREAERLLSLAGKSGRGSAWTTLAYGAIYGKLSGAARTNYKSYAENARALGNTQIEVVDAERFLYGLGTKRNPSGAIANLEKAASQGNPDAIKYLIRLVRDGNDADIRKNVRKARIYLESYGKSLPAESHQQQVFLLRVATTHRSANFEILSRDTRSRSDFSSIDFQKQIFQANPNFSIYLAQESLRRRNIYGGPLNGLATARTVASIQRVCGNLKPKFDCGKNILSDRVVARIVVN